MGSIRVQQGKGTLFMDFRLGGKRVREYTALPDTPGNRKRLQKALDRIETEITTGVFDYQKTFGKSLQVKATADPGSVDEGPLQVRKQTTTTPAFSDFANQWYAETEITWRRSYRITQRGALDKYLIPHFKDKEVGQISKADVLAFRASLAKVNSRKSQKTLSHRRINAVMKPLRQILNEAADRFEFKSVFLQIKPLKTKRSEVMPFTMPQVQTMLTTVRPDYRNYLITRFFTAMRTAEVHGLKWKYVDFERRLIQVRESIVLNEEDELKTDGSLRDIQMSQMVFDALTEQFKATGKIGEYVFCNQAGQPINNQNFVNRVWTPLLRHLEFEYRRPYQMRHTAATLWLASGESPEWIAMQMGHSNTEMLFRIYSRFIPNLTRQDGSAIDRLLRQNFTSPLSSTPEKMQFKVTTSAPHKGDAEHQHEAQPPPRH